MFKFYTPENTKKPFWCLQGYQIGTLARIITTH